MDPKSRSAKTTLDMVFVPNSSFTSKDEYVQMAIAEACDAFNNALVHFGYTQKLENNDPKVHQVNPPKQHTFY